MPEVVPHLSPHPSPSSSHPSFPVVTVCCFVRFRIPRTKAEIEANAKRRALLKNFKTKLRNLKAADLDDLDYRRGEW